MTLSAKRVAFVVLVGVVMMVSLAANRPVAATAADGSGCGAGQTSGV